jgi:hypothetical protein
LCGVRITPTNWPRHLRSRKYLENGPNITIQPKRRGRPRVSKEPKLHRVFNFLIPIFNKPKVRVAVRRKESAPWSRLSTLEIENTRDFKDIRLFLNSVKRIVIGNIRKGITRNNNLNLILLHF